MPERGKDLKGSASIVTSSIAGKQNAARQCLMLRMESYELETGKNNGRPPSEHSKVGMQDLWVHQPLRQILQPETEKRLSIPTDTIREANARRNTEPETRDKKR